MNEINRRLAGARDDSRRQAVALRVFGIRATHEKGLIDQLPDADLTEGRKERLDAAMVAYEKASKAGDDVAREIADMQIEGVLEEARGARQQEPAKEEPPPVSSFDGGVRRQGPRPKSAHVQRMEWANESPAELFKRALRASANNL